MGRRITRDRPLSAEEKLKYGEIRRQIAEELPEIARRGRAAKPRILLKHVLSALKRERERQGLSLADVNEKSGIDCRSLTQMENDQDANVTLNTLLRYAEAMGKTLTFQIDDSAGV